jgi:non-ribosomal peptide synthetase component F
VPLEPDYPDDRLSFMLEDSQIEVVLTQKKFASRFSEQKYHVIYLDLNWENCFVIITSEINRRKLYA